MPSLPLLIYASRLTRSEYRHPRDLALLPDGVLDIAPIEAAMREGVIQRLEMAKEFLAFAEGLIAPGVSEMAARNAVSRTYYAAHHAIRALLLFEERGDVDGHREAIEAVGALLKRSPTVRAKLGEAAKFREDLLDLMERRHLADYHPYGSNAPDEPPAVFPLLMPAATALARRIVE